MYFETHGFQILETLKNKSMHLCDPNPIMGFNQFLPHGFLAQLSALIKNQINPCQGNLFLKKRNLMPKYAE